MPLTLVVGKAKKNTSLLNENIKAPVFQISPSGRRRRLKSIEPYDILLHYCRYAIASSGFLYNRVTNRNLGYNKVYIFHESNIVYSSLIP
jgi:hypothetical protein